MSLKGLFLNYVLENYFRTREKNLEKNKESKNLRKNRKIKVQKKIKNKENMMKVLKYDEGIEPSSLISSVMKFCFIFQFTFLFSFVKKYRKQSSNSINQFKARST